MSAPQFQPGDLVERTGDTNGGIQHGGLYIVDQVTPSGRLRFEGHALKGDPGKFKLRERPGRSCQSCVLHSPSGSLDDVAGPCWPCSKDPARPHWAPIAVTPKKPPTPPVQTPSTNPLEVQVGGGHYKGYAIQPIEYSMANKLDACQHSVVKYVTRFRDKGAPIKDLEKARHFIDMLIAFETAKQSPATLKDNP